MSLVPPLTRAQRHERAKAEAEAGGPDLAPLRTLKSLEVRSRIQVGQILHILAEHVQGNRPMLSTQITAAKILLDKALPDLHTTTLQTEGGNPVTLTISADDASVL